MNLKNLFKNILLASHPVGSIFITTDGDFDPHVKWGGTWELLEDSFLVGAGDTYTLGTTGGEATHTLTESEMPSHTHRPEYSTNGGSTFNDASFGRDGGTAASQYLACSNSVTVFSNYQVRMSSTGGGSAHNNLPPYTAVNMWLRIA